MRSPADTARRRRTSSSPAMTKHTAAASRNDRPSVRGYEVQSHGPITNSQRPAHSAVWSYAPDCQGGFERDRGSPATPPEHEQGNPILVTGAAGSVGSIGRTVTELLL